MTEFDVKKIGKALATFGFNLIRRNVHCELFGKEGVAMVLSIPVNHKGKNVHIALMQRELRKVGITKEQFISAYRGI